MDIIVTCCRIFLTALVMVVILAFAFGIWVLYILDRQGTVSISGDPTMALFLQVGIDVVIVVIAIVIWDKFS